MNLAVSQAGNVVIFIKDNLKQYISQLFHFYHNSDVPSAGLISVQDLLGDLQLRFVSSKDVRWLLPDKAGQTWKRLLPSVLASLGREVEE